MGQNHIDEGMVPFLGYRTWYRRVIPDQPRHLPVLVLHGGPGSSSRMLEGLEQLADDGFPVVRYDQLGCGRSDRPDDSDLWVAETFYEEIRVVREHLGLNRVHLLGHSWGGMLAMVHAVERPESIAGLVLSSAPSSADRMIRDTEEMVAQLPPSMRDAIERHGSAGTTDDPEYQAAVDEFNRRHICRLDPYPEVLMDESDKGEQVYHTMSGPSEFSIIGRLKDWDFTPRLGEITRPTLLLSGRHDEYTPEHAQMMLEAIPDARWVCFEESAHSPFLEEPEKYREVVVEFLEGVEAAEATAARPGT